MCANAVKHLTATSDWFYIPWHQGHPLHLPPQATDFYRHKRSKNGHRNLTATSDQALKCSCHAKTSLTHGSKKRSLAAVKKWTKNEQSHCHKRSAHLTATSEVQAIILGIPWPSLPSIIVIYPTCLWKWRVAPLLKQLLEKGPVHPMQFTKRYLINPKNKWSKLNHCLLPYLCQLQANWLYFADLK